MNTRTFSMLEWIMHGPHKLITYLVILGLSLVVGLSEMTGLYGAGLLDGDPRARQEQFFSVKSVPRVYAPTKLVRVADVPIVFKNGILFTFLSERRGERMFLSGSFLSRPLKLQLLEGVDGIYYVFVPINLAAGTYTYRFLRNSIWMNDPKQFYTERDALGKEISAFRLTQDLEYHATSLVRTGHAVYTFYLKDEGYQDVRWMGTANVWNAERDRMVLKNGYWSIRKHLAPDEPYYLFLIDGNMTLDPLNGKVAYASFQQEVSVVQTTTDYFLYELE